MIDVERREYPEKTFYPHGREMVFPAYYVCDYRYHGRKIAYYDSRHDCIYLNSDFVTLQEDGTRKTRGRTYDKAMSCKYAEAYKELFAMIGADETTDMNEYSDVRF